VRRLTNKTPPRRLMIPLFEYCPQVPLEFRSSTFDGRASTPGEVATFGAEERLNSDLCSSKVLIVTLVGRGLELRQMSRHIHGDRPPERIRRGGSKLARSETRCDDSFTDVTR